MDKKPPAWADLLLTGWVLLVAVIFFGPTFAPRIGRWTVPASALYLGMVMAAAATLALTFLRRRG